MKAFRLGLGLWLSALVMGGGSGWTSSAEAQDVKKGGTAIRALLVTGGCCHDYDGQKKAIMEGVSARANVNWVLVHEGGSSTNHRISLFEKENWADDFDVVVHNECFATVTDPEFVKRVVTPHHKGKGAVVIHCAMHTFRDLKSDEWRELLGVTTRRHEAQHPLDLKMVKSDHPILKTFPKSWKTGNEELYVIEKTWDKTVPLIQAYGVDTKKDHTVVWTNTYGQGKVFGTTLFHHTENIKNPDYLDMLTRGILWTVDKLDKDGNPLPGYGKEKK